MGIRTPLASLAASLLAASLPAAAQVGAPSPRELIAPFDLAGLFGPGAVAAPFDDPAAFPYWVLDAGGNVVAVIEGIAVDPGAPDTLVLDAQLLDGNDLRAAVRLEGR